jgi:RNA polymerase sigma-70 factor (ECF subfamily)
VEPAWDELAATLRGFVARRVPAAEVEDLLQECFVRILEGLPTLAHRDRFAAWVFQIARNLIADRGRRKAPLGTEVMELEGPTDGEVDDGKLLLATAAGWAGSALEDLPAHYADVLRWSELDVLPHRVIAAKLGVSVSAIKSRVQRGRRLLRDRLERCCAFEFDRRGGLVSTRRKGRGRCRTGGQSSTCDPDLR